MISSGVNLQCKKAFCHEAPTLCYIFRRKTVNDPKECKSQKIKLKLSQSDNI